MDPWIREMIERGFIVLIRNVTNLWQPQVDGHSLRDVEEAAVRREREGESIQGLQRQNTEYDHKTERAAPLLGESSVCGGLRSGHRYMCTQLLQVCKVGAFHGRDAAWLMEEPTFRRNVSPPSSGWKRISEIGTSAVTGN
jgi:hypothetical protein